MYISRETIYTTATLPVRCLRLEVLESQEALAALITNASDGIAGVRKELQSLGPAPVATDVQHILSKVTRS